GAGARACPGVFSWALSAATRLPAYNVTVAPYHGATARRQSAVMNETDGIAAQRVLERTSHGEPPARPAHPRCRLAWGGSTEPYPVGEVTCLLRRRLAVAALINLAAFSVYLVLNLLRPSADVDVGPYVLPAHVAVVVANSLLVALLWSRVPLSVAGLRAVE